MTEAATPIQIHGLTHQSLEALASERLPTGAGIARQIYAQVFHEGRFDPSALGVNEKKVAAWRAHFAFDLPEIVREVQEDGPLGPTGKVVMRASDGLEYEAVLIPMGRERHTLCISTQVGCKMGCAFCETGRMGLLRNLQPHEIMSQLLVARHVLGWNFGRIVFMGMGEALDNLDGTLTALHIMNDKVGLSMPQEAMTVCTVGRLDGLRALKELGWKRLNVSISLNAAFDELRDKLMPVNRTAKLGELQKVMVEYRPRANFCWGINYCLMPGINDQKEAVQAIAEFCAPLGRALVNVIPYNPGGDPLTRAPSDEEVDQFIHWLKDAGLAVRKRITKGRSVMAACGQLGNVELRKSKLPVRRSLDLLPSSAVEQSES